MMVLSALVRHFLIRLGSGTVDDVRLKRNKRVLRERIAAFCASGRLSRNVVYRRDA